MTITVEITQVSYAVDVPVENPDVEQFMHAIEIAVNQSGYSESEIEDYILAWASEIKTKRNGKN
jgi:hypothetical protein